MKFNFDKPYKISNLIKKKKIAGRLIDCCLLYEANTKQEENIGGNIVLKSVRTKAKRLVFE